MSESAAMDAPLAYDGPARVAVHRDPSGGLSAVRLRRRGHRARPRLAVSARHVRSAPARMTAAAHAPADAPVHASRRRHRMEQRQRGHWDAAPKRAEGPPRPALLRPSAIRHDAAPAAAAQRGATADDRTVAAPSALSAEEAPTPATATHADDTDDDDDGVGVACVDGDSAGVGAEDPADIGSTQADTAAQQSCSGSLPALPPAHRLDMVPVATVPWTEENQVCRIALVRGDYGPPSAVTRSRLHSKLIGWRCRMSVEQALSLRQWLLIEKAIQRHWHLQRIAVQVAADYEQGWRVLDIVKYYDLPPIACCRAILKQRGHSPARVKQAIARPAEVLDADDASEVETAKRNDLVGGQDEVIRQLARQFEVTMTAFLGDAGIPVLTEAQQREQQSPDAPAQPTPDFLICDPRGILVNGHVVRWIDAKNFYGSCTRFMQSKLRQQARCYLECFGPGAFVFSHGYCEDFSIPGVIALDASAIANVSHNGP